MNKTEDVCCLPFDPALWDKKTTVWKEKKFIQGWIPQFLHIPLPVMFGHVITRLWKQATDAGAAPDIKDFLMLSFDPSPWKSELYLSVTKKVQGADNTTISGTFLTRVFDGPYNAVPQWIKEMDEYVAKQNKIVKKYYFYYTTCPKCAQKYGHNYVVVFAQI